MSDDLGPLGEFCGAVRLFPLPNLVLFPCVVQPLHVFEPRYRQLLTDALADDRLMAMALLRPGWEKDYHKQPPLHPVVCVGKIFKEERLSDGRYNLLLHGLCRARILEEVPAGKLYRCARVDLLEETAIASSGAERQLRRRLGEKMSTWFAAQPAAQEQLRKLLQSDLALGTLCDIFGFALPLEVEVKQQLLEQLDVEARVQSLLGFLETTNPLQSPKLTDRKFPPEFSSN
jgi:Lon protease-like protein